ncbi:MAG TPA: PAS domain-containing protein, partial [Thermoanaerobaculia bacterium]
MKPPDARVDDVARSEAQLQALLDDIQDPAWLLDRDGRLVAFNSALRRQCATLSLPEPRPGIRFAEIIQGDASRELYPFWDDLMQRALAGRSVLADSSYTVRGIKHYIGVSTVPVVVGDRIDGAVFIVHDLTTERRREQNDLIELALTRIFSTGTEMDSSLERTIEFLCESEGWDMGVAWLVVPETGLLSPVATFSTLGDLTSAFVEQVRVMSFSYGHGLPGRVWKSGD